MLLDLLSPKLLVMLLLIATLAALVILNLPRGAKGALPYLPAPALFSPAERAFLAVLDQVVGTKYRVLGKVRIADLAQVKPGLDKAARMTALNRVAQKHFDFVVCNAADLSVVCAVELNDKSHAGRRVKARDELVSRICAVIGLPLLQVQARQSYSVDALRAEFQELLTPRESTGQTPNRRASKRAF